MKSLTHCDAFDKNIIKNNIEIVDFKWLSEKLIEKFNILGYEKVWLLNKDFDLEKGTIIWLSLIHI